jgi:hypothetical protein
MKRKSGSRVRKVKLRNMVRWSVNPDQLPLQFRCGLQDVMNAAGLAFKVSINRANNNPGMFGFQLMEPDKIPTIQVYTARGEK